MFTIKILWCQSYIESRNENICCIIRRMTESLVHRDKPAKELRDIEKYYLKLGDPRT